MKLSVNSNLFVLYGLVNLAVGIVLVLTATGVIKKKEEEDEDENVTDPPPEPDVVTESPTEPEPEEEQGFFASKTAMEKLVLSMQIIMGIFLIAAPLYIWFYKLRNYHGYVRYLAKLAWGYPIPAVLIIIGLTIDFFFDIPLVGPVISRACYGIAFVFIAYYLFMYFATKAARYANKKYDEAKKEFNARMVRYGNAVREYADAKQKGLTKRLDALRDAAISLGATVGESAAEVDDTLRTAVAQGAEKTKVFSTIDSALRVELSDPRYESIPRELRKTLMNDKRVLGQSASSIEDLDPVAKEKRLKLFRTKLRRQVNKHVPKNKRDIVWQQTLLFLTNWKHILEEKFPDRHKFSFPDFTWDEKDNYQEWTFEEGKRA